MSAALFLQLLCQSRDLLLRLAGLRKAGLLSLGLAFLQYLHLSRRVFKVHLQLSQLLVIVFDHLQLKLVLLLQGLIVPVNLTELALQLLARELRLLSLLCELFPCLR